MLYSFAMRFRPTLLIFVMLIGYSGFVRAQAVQGVSSIVTDESLLFLACPEGIFSRRKPSKNYVLDVRVQTTQKLRGSRIQYNAKHGKIFGDGETVRWDLTDQRAGNYQISAVQMLNGKQVGEPKTATVSIANNECQTDCACPLLSVSQFATPVNDGQIHVVTARMEISMRVEYLWSVENGEIVAGQGTSQIKVRVKRSANGQDLKVAVEIFGIDPACNCSTKESASAKIID